MYGSLLPCHSQPSVESVTLLFPCGFCSKSEGANRIGTVVIAPLFLQPGKHAGAGGDLACILDAAAKAALANEDEGGFRDPPRLVMAELVAPHPLLTSLLVQRVRQAVPIASAHL